MRPLIRTVAAALVLALCAGATPAGDSAPPSPGQRVFFREPDAQTASEIKALISRIASGSVEDRTNTRRRLERIGWWSVDPLLAAVGGDGSDAPRRSAAILTLDAIHDRRAVEPLRRAVIQETSHPFVAGFAALALGRFRDEESISAFATALRTSKSIVMLRAAVPFALAKIATPAARDLLVERLRTETTNEPVRAAMLLSAGFFPDVALDPVGGRPGADLLPGFANRGRGQREAALLAYLVASWQRRDTREFLIELIDSTDTPEVLIPALLGLSRHADAATTEILARTALRHGDDRVKETAADLLIPRGDPAAKPFLLQIVRSPSSARLRASALLGLAHLVDDESQAAVIDRIRDRTPLLRATAAVGSTRLASAERRAEALQAIDQRLRQGESDTDVRTNLELARSVLSGLRADVRWVESGPETLFEEMSLTWEQRLLRLVNLRVEACLDLAKIHNLQTDTEVATDGPVPDGDGPPGPGDAPDVGTVPRGDADAPTVGSVRTSAWQELRDLKKELRRSPYFGLPDLPGPGGAETGK